MCVVAFAFKADARWPLVLIGNRDERHDRASAPLAPWPGLPTVLGGRDLVSGGGWLGVSTEGRLAVVTNLRGWGGPDPAAPSRGWLVRDALTGTGECASPARADLTRFSPMNLVMIGAAATYFTNRPEARVQNLEPGLYGMSNGGLEDGWPKTRRLKDGLAEWLREGSGDVEPLLAALRDETPAGDHELPATGLELEAERDISPVFIRRALYGTRCSSVVRIGAGGDGLFVERRYDPHGEPAGETRLTFPFPL